MKKLEISLKDLRLLKDETLSNYVNYHNKGLTGEAFWGKCALEAAISLLERKGIKLDIKYPDHNYK